MFLSQTTLLRHNFLSWVPDCDSHSPALLDLFILAFPPFGNSDHIVVSVSIDFPSNLQQEMLFNRIACGYSRAHWNGFHHNFKDVPWEDIFKFSAFAAASKFCECVQVETDIYIPYRKYQVKPHSSPWLSAACAAAIFHRIHFFHLYQQNKSSESKLNF